MLMIELRGPRVLLRSGKKGEAPRLLEILSEPAVATRWGNFSLEDAETQFVETDDALIVLVVELDGEVIGAIQFGEENDPQYRHANIDLFLTTSRHGQGLGTESIRVLARYLFEERGHHRLSIDPAVDNVAAIRAYEAVGFRPVGVMRKYEQGPDGRWHDGLLMDMLVEDFEDPVAK
jgi:aminoglycoside 6'-N-acetyltransferase